MGSFWYFYCSYFIARKWSRDKKTEQNKKYRIVVLKDKEFTYWLFLMFQIWTQKHRKCMFFFLYKYLPNYDFLIPSLQNYDKHICIILCQIQFFFYYFWSDEITGKKERNNACFPAKKLVAIIEPIKEIINCFLESQFVFFQI